MAVKTKTKVYVAIGVVVIGLIIYGATKGAVKPTNPSDSFGSSQLPQSATQNGLNSDGTPSVVGQDGDNKPLKVIRTWTRRDCSLAPWLVTDKLGYFQEEGVKLVFTGEIQPPQQIPSLLSGDNDVATFHPNSAAVAINGGAPLKGVSRCGVEPSADFDPEFRHMWWFVNPEKHPNVKSFADLNNIEGQLIFSVITTTQCSDFLANQILDHNGVPRDKIEWVTMPDVQAIQSLKQGQTDVGGVHPPFYKGMLDAGQLKIADTLDAKLPPESAGLTYFFFTEEFIKNNPEAVRGFTRAMVRGLKFINDNPEQARLWTQEAIGIPVSANHYYTDNLRIEEEQIIPWLNDLENVGAIPPGKLKPSDLVTHEFEDLDYVAPST
ncbi:MAG: ABC transporter substrate-binding protein [Deltaproteobacteria bacterium]|jgi:ABC-type nitrate/sulfonate/bicarbonate transport system substrate-binding protein|nr:ABC transporter substrate-binding protein [Deltaproteobacteria bacterium]